MKQLISITLLLFILATSYDVCAQSKTSETLTILIDWETNGKNKIYISEVGKEVVEKTLEGKFQEKELSIVSKSLNDLLNGFTMKGWKLQSSFTMNEAFNIQCFIFLKD
jgi:type IV pilus biogenesis protein CpaD/CtpE